jgi:hypothetical protein
MVPQFVVVEEKNGVKHRINRQSITHTRESDGRLFVFFVSGLQLELPTAAVEALSLGN